MPTYEYECLENGHRFEEYQFITEDPIEVCPYCGGPTRRLISGGAGIIFKGTGFYQTDYRSTSYKKAEKAERGEAGSSSPPAGSASKTTAPAGAGEGTGRGSDRRSKE
jgi:putative FmdB family regulatory protein